jgi:hypothetical protein
VIRVDDRKDVIDCFDCGHRLYGAGQDGFADKQAVLLRVGVAVPFGPFAAASGNDNGCNDFFAGQGLLGVT